MSNDELMEVIRSAAADLGLTPLKAIQHDAQAPGDKAHFHLTPPVR